MLSPDFESPSRLLALGEDSASFRRRNFWKSVKGSGAIDRLIAGLSQVAKDEWVRAKALKLEANWSKEYGMVILVERNVAKAGAGGDRR